MEYGKLFKHAIGFLNGNGDGQRPAFDQLKNELEKKGISELEKALESLDGCDSPSHLKIMAKRIRSLQSVIDDFVAKGKGEYGEICHSMQSFLCCIEYPESGKSNSINRCYYLLQHLRDALELEAMILEGDGNGDGDLQQY